MGYEYTIIPGSVAWYRRHRAAIGDRIAHGHRDDAEFWLARRPRAPREWLHDVRLFLCADHLRTEVSTSPPEVRRDIAALLA